MNIQLLQHRRIYRNISHSSGGGGGSGVLTPNFEIFTYPTGIDLHDLSLKSDGSNPYDTWIDWGDNSPIDKLRCPLPTAVDDPVKWMSHSYKSSGLKPITITTFDGLGESASIQRNVNITLAAPEASIPYGRTFSGVDKFPGVDQRLLKFGQPLEYLDTSPPTEAIVNPSLIRTVNTVTSLNAAFAELGSSGGTILWTGGNIDGWIMPDRPVDSNGVRYNTVIWIKTDASVRPVGYPAEYTRMTPAIGVQLPAFRSTNTSTPAIFIGNSVTIDGRYKYNVRFTGFGITVTPTYTNVRTGGGLVTFGKYSSGIVFEQCYSYLPSEQTSNIGVRRDFAVYGGRHAWIDGWHWGNRDDSTDSQAIAGWSINGPIKIVNCFLAGSECWMTGGAAPDDSQNPEIPWRPRDVEIRLCHLWRDTSLLRWNVRYYDGSGSLHGGKLLNSNVSVTDWNATSNTLTLATPVTVPDGTFALPNIGYRLDYVIYVRSGTGAGQCALVTNFNDSTHLVLSTSSTYRGGITTPLDATSIIELRFRIRWVTKNNGEFKDCRRAFISECVFENGAIGDDSQYNMVNFKTTVNSSIDYYPFTGDISLIDCLFINTYGGITLASLPREASYGDHGIPAQRFHIENILEIAGDPIALGGLSMDKFKALGLNTDTIHIKGLTAIGYKYGVMQYDVGFAGSSNLDENQYVHGFIGQAPTTPNGNTAYWFGQLGSLDLSSADYAGNAIFGIASIPPGSPGTWYTEPTATLTDIFNNPDNTDFWGAADYEIKPALAGLIAATPDRLDWARLQSRTNGVRADVSIIPYQWD